MKIYSVYDDKAQVWTQPFFQMNDAVAQRSISNAANQEGHNFNMNPEDYALYCIGEFNDEDGTIVSTNTKLLDVATLIRQPEISQIKELTN